MHGIPGGLRTAADARLRSPAAKPVYPRVRPDLSAIVWTNKYYNQLNRIVNTHVNSIVNGQGRWQRPDKLGDSLKRLLRSQITK